jgi:hypothetical protein
MRALDVDVPQELFEALGQQHPAPGEYLKYLADTLRRENIPDRFRRAVDKVANKLLPRHQYQYYR